MCGIPHQEIAEGISDGKEHAAICCCWPAPPANLINRAGESTGDAPSYYSKGSRCRVGFSISVALSRFLFSNVVPLREYTTRFTACSCKCVRLCGIYSKIDSLTYDSNLTLRCSGRIMTQLLERAPTS